MCGICGFTGAIDDRSAALLRAMTDAMGHRGPDAVGHERLAGPGVSFGHTRLSVIDLASGQQPMRDGRLLLTFNGEIYNYRELRAELEGEGCVFATSSDTEVLLKGYARWGTDMVHRLNGMWAFALFDADRNRLFLSRDRFGKKPLYYCHRAGFLAFASELSALALHPAVSREIDPLSLQKYYAYGFIPAPRSILRDVRKLPGGHNLVYDLNAGTAAVSRWWSFTLEPDDALAADPETTAQTLLETLDRAVRRRMIADVPLGALLSGGVDSSAVSTLMARALGGEELKTFSIGFDEADFDESRFSRLVADGIGSNHFTETCSIDQARDIAGAVVALLDEPMGDGSIVPTSLLCRMARRHVTVALSGDGADELFAGYDPFKALMPARVYDTLVPRPLHRAIRLVIDRMPASLGNMTLDFKAKRFLRGLSYPRPLWNSVWLGALEPAELRELTAEPVDVEAVYEEAITIHDECAGLGEVDRTLQFYTRLYLQDAILTKMDRASMMHSLEVRSPFLDIEVVDLVRRMPWRLKFRPRGGVGKYILKHALRGVVPDLVLRRRKKGFGMPIGKWFASGAFTLNDALPGGLNTPFVRGRLADHRGGVRDDRAFLWNTWVLKNNAHIAH